ncbi:GntR family transcriptional regulator [Thermopolyspora sp. NPDC052614]|uniref:GntR family transcriptional regulator n=1 Tax=Thermopolyspora sp. NPDC052614 TaxID=3155682 RepID=UPI0034442E52
MVRINGAETLGVDVYEQLRSDILDGRFLPGERLQPARLSAEYGVSAGVIREALTRLSEQRLTVVEPNRGHRVVTISVKQIRDLVELRQINEGAALRLSMERGDAAWEGGILAAHHRLKAAGPAHASPDSWAIAHRDYHMSLFAACGNDRLLALCEELFAASELYRRWSSGPVDATTPAERHIRGVEVETEHAGILEAVLARDIDRALARYHDHLEHTARNASVAVENVARRSAAAEKSSAVGRRAAKRS